MTTNDDLYEQFLIRCEPEVSSSAERQRRLRSKLIRFFASRRCEDAEGLADETIGRLVNIVYASQEIQNPSGYSLGTARNVYREHVRREARLTQFDEDAEAAIEKQQVIVDRDPFLECAEQCFQRLPDDKRLLLEQYYAEEGDREALVRQAGTSLAALRTKIHRLKTELKKCYQECIRSEDTFKRN